MKLNGNLLLITLLVSLWALYPTGNLDAKVVKVDTGYYVIPLSPTFNTKAMRISFNHINSGTKKIEASQQIVGLQMALWNKSNKEIKVRRNDFYLNKQSLNFFVVKEKKNQPLVVKVPPGKAIGIVNYYILDKSVQGLKDIKIIYSGVTRHYQKKKLSIPVIKKSPAVKGAVKKGNGITGTWGLDEAKSKQAADGNTAGLMKTVIINRNGTFKALYGTEGTWKIKNGKILISYKNRYNKDLPAFIVGGYLKFPAPAIRNKFCYLKRK